MSISPVLRALPGNSPDAGLPPNITQLTLDNLEAVIVTAKGEESLEVAANDLRLAVIDLPGTLPWVRRRIRQVHEVLVRVIGLIPDRLAGCAAAMVTVASVSRATAP